jgi:hypothetical protein
VRQEELLHVLKTLATLRVPPAQDIDPNGELISTCRDQAYLIADHTKDIPSSNHLTGFYPLLLDLSFMEHSVPSMWIYSSEHHRIFSDVAQARTHEVVSESPEIVHGNELPEVTSKDLVKRCLELIGRERSLH